MNSADAFTRATRFRLAESPGHAQAYAFFIRTAMKRNYDPEAPDTPGATPTKYMCLAISELQYLPWRSPRLYYYSSFCREYLKSCCRWIGSNLHQELGYTSRSLHKHLEFFQIEPTAENKYAYWRAALRNLDWQSKRSRQKSGEPNSKNLR